MPKVALGFMTLLKMDCLRIVHCCSIVLPSVRHIAESCALPVTLHVKNKKKDYVKCSRFVL